LSPLNIFLVVLIFILKILDGVSTYQAIVVHGHREGNPLVNWTFKHLGIVPSLTLGVFYVTAIAVFIASGKRQSASIVLTFCAVILLAIVIKNFRLCVDDTGAKEPSSNVGKVKK
jgi:hypothetical protein